MMNGNNTDVNVSMGGNESPWLTATEAAAYLRLSLKTLRNYMYQGAIPYYKSPLTGTLRFKASELDAWMEQGAKGAERR